ncbi:MAG: diadenylate cyclase CdaA [Eubacteriales bacterium]|nr:diadenylate cyclase CdaA [Eubacteriales bacterium]
MWIESHLPWMKISSISMTLTDVIEIIILSFLVYSILVWVKNSRAWTLLKGMLVLGMFVAMAYLFKMDTLTFLIEKGVSLVIMAAIIIFQPELRRALEQLGEKEFISALFNVGNSKEVIQRCSDRTVNELVRATLEMAKVKTGALMVLEQNEKLEEYERTGIDIDAIVSSQLLINIFEHNTPLHDGAVIIKGDKIRSATCYLPLSENKSLDKELGTRHRAGVGISEVTDSLTIIVSEETGKIALAKKGILTRNVSEEKLREQLILLQNKSVMSSRKRIVGKTKKDRGERNQAV